MKVAFETLGCRVNQYETEAMIEKFIKSGYDIVNFGELADVYVINTCTVTNMGDKKSRQMISRARRTNSKAIIAVVGCYSQIAPEKVSKISGVDIVIGTRNKGDIVEKVEEYICKKEQIILVEDVMKNNVFEELNIENYRNKTRAFLKIQDGCNNFCSYCLIPFARGGICSKEPKKVIKEIKKLVENGFKEVTLSGIQIALYGTDSKDKLGLIDLLEEVDKIEDIERVRIGSISPKYFKDEIIDRFSKLKKLCPHFHLSLQSGCDETLRRMNRGYTTEEYKHIVQKLREKIKDVSITTDIIVGFPGESEEEFKKTYEFLEEIKLSKMHIFKYSPRLGTKACEIKEQIDGNIKDKRSNSLINLNKKLEKDFTNKFLKKELKVLYEEKSNLEENSYEGYTPNYIKVVTKSNMNLQGKIVNTIIKDVKEDYVLGKLQ